MKRYPTLKRDLIILAGAIILVVSLPFLLWCGTVRLLLIHNAVVQIKTELPTSGTYICQDCDTMLKCDGPGITVIYRDGFQENGSWGESYLSGSKTTLRATYRWYRFGDYITIQIHEPNDYFQENTTHKFVKTE